MCHGMCVVGGELAELPLPFYRGFLGLKSGLGLLQQALGLSVGLFLPSGRKEVGGECVWER